MHEVLKEPPRCTLSVNNDMLITNRGWGWVVLSVLSPSTFFQLRYYEYNSGLKIDR